MDIRLYNARILTMEENKPILNGEVWVRDERIFYVGDGGNVEEFFQQNGLTCMLWDEEIDCKGDLIMPGFKDAHTHSGMTCLRSYADDMVLSDWLNRQVFPVEARLTAEDIHDLTKLAVLEYLTSGITAVFDMYLTPRTIAGACSQLGMRCVQTGGVNNFSQSVELIEELDEELNGKDPLLSFIPGFHAEYTCSRELLERMAKLAHRLKKPIYTHMCETESEVAGCVERYGTTPPVFLDSLGMFDYGGGGFHCVHMTEEDMEVMKRRGLSVITNPGSNTKLASGIAPVQEFLRRGINVALGTDGPASNNCLDMFREMFLTTGLAKLREKDASAVDAMDVLRMATVNGSRAMGLGDADVLAEGKLADLIVLDLHQPNMQPLNNIAKNIVYSGSKQNVRLTMIHGRILYREGMFHVGEEPEDIYAKANEIARRVTREAEQ